MRQSWFVNDNPDKGANMTELNIIIDGSKFTAYQGENILETAARNGIEIPTLCHDPRLEPYSSCYVCVVEIEGSRNLQPSCSTKVAEGMVIRTGSEKVKKARKTALDLLASNHYADCAAPCKLTCPAGVDVQGYISLIEKGLFSEAIALIKEVNPLPAICGRVCVRPCEVACRRNLLGEGAAVGIDYLKRFAADFDLASSTRYRPTLKPDTGKKVAVIGAGPGGLSTAWFLRREGHAVDIFEASPNPGGMLRYGIPPYRLPNELINSEVESITDLGVNIFYNRKLGADLSYGEILESYQAMVLTIGSQAGTRVGCPGDDAGNVFSGIDFLRNIEITGQKPDFSGKRVAVVGGGNTAMDCCRTAIRLGAEKVYVIYRRTEKEMPANPIEIHESRVEGVEYLFLNNPAEIIKDENGQLKSMKIIRMELGEPDASGRRRPVAVEGSEYEIGLDYVLAAIGQKTVVDFMHDVNAFSKVGELKVNKWGDLDANRKTLQTGIPSVFAAGDGVTGPATLIEAIAQAKVAARSCDQYLKGQSIEPLRAEFVSRKDNFKTQEPALYEAAFTQAQRAEMPLLPPAERSNFNEVELGYTEKMALQETFRCLECGCSEYFTCDLKRRCDEYGAEQNKFSGSFNEHRVDFRHPYIEIDNNKCILCSRCVRICHELAGADALGLVNRGFETFVAPALGKSLPETNCESCGLCISACPTGAITENFVFKPGPVKLTSHTSICNFCSVGCSVEIHEHKGFVWKITGHEGMVNPDKNICRYAKFGYKYLNSINRISRPMVRKGDTWTEISPDEAYSLIKHQVNSVKPVENAFFAGARLSNEELYLIRKLAKEGVNCHNIHSFHYLGRGTGFIHGSDKNVPFKEISQATSIYLLGSEIHEDNAVVGFMVNQARVTGNIPVTNISVHETSLLKRKADVNIGVLSYYHFLKAVNYYLVRENLQNGLFIRDHCQGFEEYRQAVVAENYDDLVSFAGFNDDTVIRGFAESFNKEHHAVLIFSELELSGNEVLELNNLVYLTGKYGKTASGLICLKEKNNSQGIWDMGIHPSVAPGAKLTSESDNLTDLLATGNLRNLLIFGEDPVGCSSDPAEIREWIDQADFVVVQDYFMSETAELADLVLPSSLPFEFAGSFTNTQRVIQEFEPVLPSAGITNSIEQIAGMLKEFGLNDISDSADARSGVLRSVSMSARVPEILSFSFSDENNYNPLFNHGCDLIVKIFDEEFNKYHENI